MDVSQPDTATNSMPYPEWRLSFPAVGGVLVDAKGARLSQRDFGRTGKVRLCPDGSPGWLVTIGYYWWAILGSNQ